MPSGTGAPVFGVHDLDEEVVLHHVQAVAGLGALGGDAGPTISDRP